MAAVLGILQVHMIGEADPMKRASRDLLSKYSDEDGQRTEIVHSEGHKFPSDPSLYETLHAAAALHCRL